MQEDNRSYVLTHFTFLLYVLLFSFICVENKHFFLSPQQDFIKTENVPEVINLLLTSSSQLT